MTTTALSSETPRATVVIATFNGLPYVHRQLDALVSSPTTSAFEIVVADNGSTDGTRAQIEARGDDVVRVVDASARQGRCFARNQGASAALGNLLLFLDQDDVAAPGYVDAMVGALAESSIVAARMDGTLLNNGWLAAARGVPQSEGLPPPSPLPWAYACTLGIRRDAFTSVRGFDEEMNDGSEDLDLCWRLHAAGHDLIFVPDAVLHYRFPRTKRALFAQGRRYGRARVTLGLKHPDVITERADLVSWFRLTAGSSRRLLARDPGVRGRGAGMLGRCVGLAEGTIRYRSLRW